ncbi:MAG TPA: site-specific integrase, partial [Fimbriimonas sp.]
MRLHRTVHLESETGIDIAIEEFLLHQKSSRHSEHTLIHYNTTFKHFKSFLAKEGVKHVQDIESVHLRRFLTELQDSYRPKTVHGIATDIRAFLRFHLS